MVATRRERPDAVGARRGDGRGAKEKEPARWAGPRRGGLERRGGFAGALGRLRQAGQKRGGGPRRRKILFFQIYFQEIFKCLLSNIILNKKMTSFENVPKIKVV